MAAGKNKDVNALAFYHYLFLNKSNIIQKIFIEASSLS